MKWSTEKSAVLGFAFAVIIVAAVSDASWKSIHLLLANAGLVEHTHRVLSDLKDISAELKDAESSQRDYFLTGDESFSFTYTEVRTSLLETLNDLKLLVSDNKPQLRRINLLEDLIAQKLVIFQKTPPLRQTEKPDILQLSKSIDGRSLMPQIRALIADAENAEQALRKNRSDAAQKQANEALGTTSVSTFANLFLLSALGFVICRELKMRRRVESELRNARDLAIESTRLKSEFLANMSHEIRTPMNGVLGMTNLLLGTHLDREQKHYAESAQISAESLLTVINDILDFSKIEAGKLSFESIEFELRNSVEVAVGLFAQRAEAKGLELACTIPTDVPNSLKGDPNRLNQTLVNFIGNAVKFTQNGEVVVRVRKISSTPEKVTLRFSVTDTGIGITPDAQKLLFMPFSQADGSTTRQFGGTGLGLAISKKLVEGMHGELGLTSEPGRGSEFWFTATFEYSMVRSTPPIQADLEGKKVLVVDDNETNRTIVEAQLRSWGALPSLAQDATEALTLLAGSNKSFDAALIDMQMPRMNGLDLGRKITAQGLEQPPKLIMLTSLGTQDEAELKLAGFHRWLTKPVRQSELHDCLISVFSRIQIRPEVRNVDAPRALHARGSLSLEILLAEDNRINQMVALGMLSKLGLKADVAATGVEVLKATAEKSYDVILMDCQMPDMDGYEAARNLRKAEGVSTQRLHIVAMTAHAMSGDREHCLDAGMDDYLSKPINIKALEEILRRVPKKSNAQAAPSMLRLGNLDELRNLESQDEPGVLDQLINLFHQDAPPILVQLHDAVRSKNTQSALQLSHKLSGMCGVFGVPEFVSACHELESSARAGAWEDAERAFREIADCFDELSEALKRAAKS